MSKSLAELQRKLETSGYLSLNQFVDYIRQAYPGEAISYPTALRLCRTGKLNAKRVGDVWRISHMEIARWVSEGNLPTGFQPKASHPLDPFNQ